MLAMQDKSGLIQEQSVTNPDIRSTLGQRDELNLLQTSQIIESNIELLPSQMTKSQATMVNEAATCSTTNVDTINSNTNANLNTNTNSTTNLNNMSTPTNEQNQVSSRLQSQHSNNSHATNSTNSTTSSTTTTATTNTSCNMRAAKRTANDYRFGKTIGEGSFSSVYIAQDIHTKKEVASKY